MADFKKALEALGQGKIQADALAKQLDVILSQSPEYAPQLLTLLDQAATNNVINAEQQTELKRKINQFRRANALETESLGSSDDEATVFASTDNMLEDEEATVFSPSDIANDDADKTALMDDFDNDATMRREHDDESTVVMGGNQPVSDAELDQITSELQTGQTGTDVDFDLMTDSGITGGTGPVETAWGDPTQQVDNGTTELTTGGIIKQRFKLLDVLGVGGMGKVYKGIDLLKEEARDKNPYVAIKLLNEDFKSHPEAFISLQRESSRQQKLAHPNIATVYDFDRCRWPRHAGLHYHGTHGGHGAKGLHTERSKAKRRPTL